jgi:beta-glucuronidase
MPKSINSGETKGYRYTFMVTLTNNATGERVDVYRLPVGLRTVAWTATNLLINGQSFYCNGVNRHEDANVRGEWEK